MIKPKIETLEFKRMSDEEYFSDKYKDYISNSKLNLANPLQNGSPEIFYTNKTKLYTNSLTLGSAVHCIVLQKDKFELVYNLYKPTSKLGLIADYLYPIYIKNNTISYKDTQIASNEIDYYKSTFNERHYNNIIEKCSKYWELRSNYEKNNKSNLETIYLDYGTGLKTLDCIKSVESNYQIQSLLNPNSLYGDIESLNEYAVFINFDVEIPNKGILELKFKAKLDNVVFDKENNKVVLNDLKTTFKEVSDFHISFNHYHYFRQMGIYGYLALLVAEKYYGMTKPSLEGNILIVSTSTTHSGVFKVNNNEFIKGFNEFKTLIESIVDYKLNEISRA